ncbi:hypothetical protein R1flu_006863 [Riccia fluitans]|uniref:Uncharacterized protein n=1 Tax=Riccia fluitans TaxID=41844 RepID=A0ABD1YYB3_9MARC
MAMWSEELRRLTLSDGEAELTPESRPVWQQNMELRTKFVRYPGPKPDGLHPTHFWFLEHYGLLPYFLQMKAKGIPAKVFFSIVTHDEEQGATWPNQVAVRFAEVEELGVRQYFPISQDRNENLISQVQAQGAGRSGPGTAPAKEETSPDIILGTGARDPNGDAPHQNYPDQLRSLRWSHLPRRGKSRKYQAVAPRSSHQGRSPGWGSRRSNPKDGRGTALPGFEPSDDELPMGTLRKDISHLRQEGQRTEPLVIRETGGRQALNGSRQKAIEQIPLPPPGQKKKKNKTPAVQPARASTPTAGVPQPIPVGKTLLDRLAEISRPEAMSGTAEEDQAVRDVVRDPYLPCIVPGETSEASMARYSEQMVAVVKHWTMEKADGRTDALTSVRPSVVTLAKFFLNQIPQVPGLTIPTPATDRIDELQAEVRTFGVPTPNVGRVDGGDGHPDPVGEEGCRTPPGAHIADNVRMNSIADHRAEEAEKRVQERDEELRQAQDELRRAREELAQNRADGEKQSRASEEELHRVRNDVVQREEETGRWIRNDEKMADFVREIARLRDELLTKDAKMRELEKTLREWPEEIQPGQIESA